MQPTWGFGQDRLEQRIRIHVGYPTQLGQGFADNDNDLASIIQLISLPSSYLSAVLVYEQNKHSQILYVNLKQQTINAQ